MLLLLSVLLFQDRVEENIASFFNADNYNDRHIEQDGGFMSTKNWSNLYFEMLKANDELLAKEWSAIKGNKEAAFKISEGLHGGGWKKYIDAMASLRDSAVKVDSTISGKAETLYGKIEEKWKSINDLISK